MKQTEISRIMDEYIDSDLFFDGESETDTEAVKAKALSKVQALSVTPRKKLKKSFKILIAAAAAVCCFSVAAVAAGFPRQFSRIVTKSEVTIEYDEKGNVRYSVDRGNPPFEYRDGRIIFTASEDEKDITDIIDDETPYIWSYISFDTGLRSYISVGGNPGHTGFMELINMGTEEEPYWECVGEYSGVRDIIVYGVDLEPFCLSYEQWNALYESDVAHKKTNGEGYTFDEREQRFVTDTFWGRVMPWAKKTADELDLYKAKDIMYSGSDWMTDEMFLRSLCGGGLGGPTFPGDDLETMERCRPEIDYSTAYGSPLRLENGRLILTVNGTEKDITDLMDENTPYIEAVEGEPYETYLVAGGTTENYGCTELINMMKQSGNAEILAPDGKEVYTTFGSIDRTNNIIALGDDPNGYYFTVDGEEISFEELLEYLRQGVDLNGRFDCADTTPEWFKAACKELMIDDRVRYIESGSGK